MTTLRIRRVTAFAAVGALATLGAAGEALGQGSISRMTQVRDGRVRFTFPLRADVCGSGRNVWRSGRSDRPDRDSRDVEYDVECESGPGRVVIDRSGGEVTDVRFYVGGRWRADTRATDLGSLGSREAAALLLHVARTTDGKGGRNAIFPVTLVDSVEVWRDLIRLARDDSRPRETRKQAVFWLGQLAEGPATAGLDEIVGDAAVDRDVRDQAIFALSQRPRDEGIPALIRVVRTSRDPELRKKALFWLGQSGDERALALIEELLVGRRE